ncbi:peptidoglycan D,D-transpeptidase FtsI family protein [Anaerolentibacter hominis]|uniref:peptidoglycan D,D-transpeptidase FtsI family protein n=1 Tax=Anaerolentibacter hominis TaxID=3079009 RepID=UPI003CCEE437
MAQVKTYNRKGFFTVILVISLAVVFLMGRLGYLMVAQADHYGSMAKALHERERPIKAMRGKILDCNGVVLADNKPVCTVSVIHSQIKEPERVIEVLCSELGLSEETVRKRVEKVSSIERIKANIPKETADRIREYDLAGVMIDEDYKRYYPLSTLASKVIGFTGGDNQGIIGLEVEYEKYLKGIDGKILTLTTASGVEIKNAAEDRQEPIAGNDLVLTLDVNIQKYAEQAAAKVMEAKGAKNVKMLIMNPQNGEIYACVNVPEFDLNDPFTLIGEEENTVASQEKKMDLLNEMWRNGCISDTYEPGSTFKIITAASALEAGVVSLNDSFYCPGYKIVEDRRIRCHKAGGHGSETFVDGIKNSCNPVFMEIGGRLGIERFYHYMERLGLFQKTGVDVPGEAGSIMHKVEDVKAVELATVSFGQSFQITPLQLLTAASTVINGGHSITPHFAKEIKNQDGEVIYTPSYKQKDGMISSETSATMRDLLEKVVAEGTGKRAYIEGFRIGGKTATSEKLPRSSNKYISSFVGFAPADNPQVIGIVLIDEPVGIYYGGTIAAPVIQEVFENILPYLGTETVTVETD